ncbi:flavoprotein [Saccharothrix saharensis]|uniref:flavoprotein n=1 Tax=Saccharothrix saharensis TaxID=571190 RepID=UPI00115026D9|nr:flavoprotein [Saccharothrix saharensis]
MNSGPRTVYLIVTAAPPVLGITHLIDLLRSAGWQVCLVATPIAASWMNLDDLTTRRGTLIRTEASPPGQRDSLPRADAVLVAPATFNTINKWAHGISDNLALGLLNELLGTEVPIVVVPCVKEHLRKHPAYQTSLETLLAAHVTAMNPDDVTTRSPDGLADFHWHTIISTFTRVATATAPPELPA